MPTLKLCVRSILFDLDGVLVQSGRAIQRSWMRWGAGHGVDWEVLAPHVQGRTAEHTIRSVLPHLDEEALRHEAEAVNELGVHDTADVRAIAGMSELVAGLGGTHWGIVTGSAERLARARVSAARFPQPPVLVHAGCVRQGKPDPEGYLLAAALLGAQPHDCLVLEDAPSGVQAAVSAGMHVVALATTHAAADLAAAECVVRDGRALCMARTERGIRVAVAGDQSFSPRT